MANANTEETTEQPERDRPLLDLSDSSVKKFIKTAKARGYVTLDELNATLGLLASALADSAAGPRLLPTVQRIQNELFNLGTELATPGADERQKLPRVEARHITALEHEIDELNATLPALRSFVLPGGGWPSAYFHLARTVCRRAERLVIRELGAEYPIGVQYLNRLSDALFVFGRWAAVTDGASELLWQPERT